MASIADSVTARVASDSCELGTDPIGAKLAPSESTLIQDWAEKMTGIKFDTMSQFTDYLLKKNYACSGLAGPTTGVIGAQPAVVGPVGSERTPVGGAATPPGESICFFICICVVYAVGHSSTCLSLEIHLCSAT